MKKMNRLMMVVAVIALLFAVVAPQAFGAKTFVNCNSVPCVLQSAINTANPGDTLVIQGTCLGNFEINKDLTLIGKWGATLDAQGSGTTLTITDATVVVKGLTITGGNGEDGGGILNEGGTLTLNLQNPSRTVDLPLPRTNIMSYYDSATKTVSPQQVNRVRRVLADRARRGLSLMPILFGFNIDVSPGGGSQGDL